MSVFRQVRWSFLAVFTLAVVVLLASCSKKEVKQDEPLINPSGTAGGTASPDAGAGAGDAGAGASGGGEQQDSGDLKVAYFDFDSYRINGSGKKALKGNADWMKANGSSTIQIEGHCDERGTTEYNLALGERRANAARDYLIRLGIDKSRISVISYGEERPSDPGHDESAWSKNRRAAFVVLSK
jgi:peptidoglycan-associated lipoprotein